MYTQILLITADDDLESLVRRSFEKLPGTFSLKRIHDSSGLFGPADGDLSKLATCLLLLDWDFSTPPGHDLLAELVGLSGQNLPPPIIILLPEDREHEGAELIGRGAADFAVKSQQGLARLPKIITASRRRAFLELRLSRLEKIGLEITSSLDLMEVLPRVLDLAEEMVGAQAGAVILPEEIRKYIPSPYFHNLTVKSSKKNAFLAEDLQKPVMADQPIYRNDYPSHPAALQALVKAGVSSLIASPLRIGRRPLGVLYLFDLTGRVNFGPDDAETVQIIARQLALAIENRSLIQRERLAYREIEAVQLASPALTASLELPQVLYSILAAALDLVPADTAHIFLYSENLLSFGAAIGPGGKWEKPFSEPRPEGLTYKVAREGQPVEVSNINNHPLFAGRPSEWKGSIVSLPLKIGERVVGVMNISRLEPGPFPETALRVWGLLANQAAIAIENARLYQAEQSRHREAEALRRAALALTSTVSLDEVFDRILAELHNVVPYDSATVQLLKGDQFEIIGGRGFPNLADLIGISFPVHGDNPNSLVLEAKEPVIIDDVRPKYPDYNKKPHSPSNIHGWLGVPLLFDDRVIGMLALDKHEPGFYVKDQARIAMSYAAQAAIAIENARLFEAERKQRRRMEALQAAGATLGGTLNLSEVLDHILTELGKVISYDSASVILIEGDFMQVVAGRNLPDPTTVGKRFHGTPLEREMEETRLPVILANAGQDDRFGGWSGTDYVRGWMGVPLLAGEHMIGHLAINSRRPGAYGEADANLAISFAHQAAIAVENARLHQNLKDQLKALKESQAKLVQSGKLAAIGELVAGVAHELNNPLTSIIGIAQLLQYGDVNEETSQDLDKLVAQAHRAGEIVKNLLDFARQHSPEWIPVQINEVLTSTLKIMTHELRIQNIKCTTHLASELPYTMADSHQLQQVFMNLLNNARQAMDEAHGGGNLVVTSERVVFTENAGNFELTEVIRVSIKDSGPGIPAKALPHIFDPFFTTKPEGKGTGLGLSVCHGIISEHGGQIWAESKPDRGATFFVEIPVVSPKESFPHVMTTEENKPIFSETGRILVVEDEAVLRKLMVRILKREGYQVDAAADGLEALASLAKRSYDLIVCDILMPGLSGPELYRKLRGKKPELAARILFTTGDTVSPKTLNFLEETALPYLAKPFEMKDLIVEVGKLLKEMKHK